MGPAPPGDVGRLLCRPCSLGGPTARRGSTLVSTVGREHEEALRANTRYSRSSICEIHTLCNREKKVVELVGRHNQGKPQVTNSPSLPGIPCTASLEGQFRSPQMRVFPQPKPTMQAATWWHLGASAPGLPAIQSFRSPTA